MEEGPAESRVKREEAIANNVDILNEIFRHLDATSLGRAACVSSRWKQATDEESLWEATCTRHWPTTSSQLKPVVVALGGFKRLYVKCLHPLLSRNGPLKWTKDHVYLSLSLFSIHRYERLAPPSADLRHHPPAQVRRLLDGWRAQCTPHHPSQVDIDSDDDVHSL